MRALTASLFTLCGFVAACGSEPSSSTETASAPASAGSEEIAPADIESEPEPAPEPQPQAAPQGPASVTVRALVDGNEVPARVRILDESGQVTSEAESGGSIPLRSGTHRIELQVTDPAAMADTPKQIREIFLKPGENTRVDASFPWARVQLNVLVGGRSQAGVPVKLLRDGNVVAEMKGGAKHTAITPGKYEADVMLRGLTIRVTGLQFPESATQTVPVRVKN